MDIIRNVPATFKNKRILKFDSVKPILRTFFSLVHAREAHRKD